MEKYIGLLRKYLRKSATGMKMPKFVMLCGKDMSIVKKDNRYYTSELIKQRRPDIFVIYTEKVFSIIEHDNYLDLLKFEELLIEISDGVVLFLESFGTACELGAFSYIDTLAKKMLVYVSDKFQHDSSFINDGPLRRIQNLSSIDDNRVIYTHFNPNGNVDFGNREVYNSILNFVIKKFISLDKDNILFDSDNKIIHIRPQLLMFLIIDLVYVFDFIDEKKVFKDLKWILNAENYRFKIKTETNNVFNDDDICNYIIELLQKWKILSKVRSQKSSENLLCINFEFLKDKEEIKESFGKTLFIKKLFNEKEYLEFKYSNRKKVIEIYGKLYDSL